MLTIDSNIEIDAPIDLVWKKLAKLDDVQHWVTSVKSARYATEQTEGVGAERVCDVDGLGMLQETITDWRDGETLTYAVEVTSDCSYRFYGLIFSDFRRIFI